MKRISVLVLAILCLSISSIAKQSEFVEVDKTPEAIKIEEAQYPPELIDAGVEGSLYVKALVDKNGDVIKAEISESSGYDEFDKSALTAARDSKFKPAEQDGNPVAVWVSYKVTFKLDDYKDKGK